MTEYRLEIKKGSISVHIVGASPFEIEESLDEVISLLNRIETRIKELGVKTKITDSLIGEFDKIPHIRAPQSIRDAISQLMSSEWGKTPRTKNDIIEAMKTNAIYYRRESVATELTRMTKAGLLRRIKTNKIFSYVPGYPLQQK